MKRIASLLLATAAPLLPAAPVLGQTTITLTGGTNLASLAIERDGDNDDYVRRIMRLSIGLDATIPLSQRLSLHLGGSYSEKGTAFRDRALSEYRGSLKLDYLELRMLGKALVYQSLGGVKLHLLAGPAVARQASCYRSGQVTVNQTTTGHRTPCGVEETSSLDLGVVGGGSMEMWISDRLGLLLNLLHTRGLQDIEAWTDHITMKTRTLTFHTGIIFSIS